MAVNYSQAIQDARMDQVISIIDAHASPAKLEIRTSGGTTLLATITLNDPSFTRSGSSPNTKISMNGLPKTSAAAVANGTAAIAQIKTGGDVLCIDGLTVGTSGTDIVLNTTTISIGQTVTLQTTAEIKHPGV